VIRIRTVLASALLLASVQASAAALDQLRAFANDTRSGRTEFSQTVVGRNGKQGQKASGTFVFQRPGKFRFSYLKPYQQTIVGDGKKLWTYDHELKQVTVKPMTDALGATPAALLTGGGDLERNFTLKEAGAVDGVEWIEATPKQQEAGFEKVRIGFKGGQPVEMEVRDNFAQTTLLRFGGFQKNAKTDPAEFRFEVPAGADVVGE